MITRLFNIKRHLVYNDNKMSTKSTLPNYDPCSKHHSRTHPCSVDLDLKNPTVFEGGAEHPGSARHRGPPLPPPVRISRCTRIQSTSARNLNTIFMLIAPFKSRERSANMQRSAVVVVADKTSLKRPFIFTNAVHMVGDWNYFCMRLNPPGPI